MNANTPTLLIFIPGKHQNITEIVKYYAPIWQILPWIYICCVVGLF